MMEKLTRALFTATSKVGTKELTGNNDGPFVDECVKVTGLDNQAYIKGDGKGKGYSWCAAFISWVFKTSGVDMKPNAWAPALFPANKLVKDGKYRPMDVFGITYNKIQNGHVGFVLYYPEEGDSFISLEGNWGGQVCVNNRKKAEINSVSRWI